MKDELVEVVLGGMKLRVPIVVDKETTFQIAKRVNERLRAIESTSDRIDSLDFALLAAMSFASELTVLEEESHQELDQANAERTADERELVRSLARINDALRDALEEFRK